MQKKSRKDLESFFIYDRRYETESERRKGYKAGARYVYQTSEGDLLAKSVASIIGITLSGLNTRANAYGVADRRVVMGPTYGEHKKTLASGRQGGGNAEWRKLGGKPRNENAAPFTPGSFEALMDDC